MTFQQLKYIIEISKSRSITAAAQNLFISQPSLSKSVKELETELGITILERTRHGISFTSSGMEFLSYAYRIAEQIEGMQSYFRQDETNERKINLSISAQHYMFPTDALVQFIQKAEKYHSYTVTMQEGRTTQVIHDVLVQQSQIGIIYVSKATEKFMHRLFQHKGLEFIPFRQYPPYVYLRAQHPLASRKQINVRELEPYPYVRYGQGQDPYLFSEEVIIPDMSNKKLIYVTDRSSLLSMLRNTNSFNIGTGCLLPDIVGDAIISIPVEDCIDMMEIGWLKLKNMKMTQEMTLYVQLLDDSLNRCTCGSIATEQS